jgi:hypothetical protein
MRCPLCSAETNPSPPPIPHLHHLTHLLHPLPLPHLRIQQDQESCGKYLSEMRVIMFGDGEQEPDPALQTALVTEVNPKP